MVHALEKSHSLLKPGGWLIDVHTQADLPLIELQSDQGSTIAGSLLDSSNFKTLRQAFDAIETVVKQNLFEVELSKSAEFKVTIDTYQSFQDWLEQQWDTSYLPQKTGELIKQFISAGSEDRRVIVSKNARVTVLRAL